jgi:hypothetical protein
MCTWISSSLAFVLDDADAQELGIGIARRAAIHEWVRCVAELLRLDRVRPCDLAREELRCRPRQQVVIIPAARAVVACAAKRLRGGPAIYRETGRAIDGHVAHCHAPRHDDLHHGGGIVYCERMRADGIGPRFGGEGL